MEELRKKAALLRKKWSTEQVSTELINEIQNHHPELRQLRKDLPEKLPLVDKKGKDLGISAERWLCHLLGWRHRSVHTVITWKQANGRPLFLLHMRSFQKLDSPGKLDLIGGHVSFGENNKEAASKETSEEVGLDADFVSKNLKWVGNYLYKGQRPGKNFYNHEWRDLYHLEIPTPRLDEISFIDGEVSGFFFCPEIELQQILKLSRHRIGSALKFSMPRFLECWH